VSVIAAGLKLIEGRVLLVELHAEQGRYWLRLPDGQERPLQRDAARVVMDLIGDPNVNERP
jgi:hypothetical protein